MSTTSRTAPGIEAGGTFRVSLTYDDPTKPGKSAGATDTYKGRFARLVADRLVVEAIEFETADPELVGEMTVTTTLRRAERGTDVVVLHQGLPRACPRPTTKPGPAWPWTTWPDWSKRSPAVAPGLGDDRAGAADPAGHREFTPRPRAHRYHCPRCPRTLPPTGPTPTSATSISRGGHFRDLGGYPAADGHHVRWRTLFRADGLSGLSAATLGSSASSEWPR